MTKNDKLKVEILANLDKYTGKWCFIGDLHKHLTSLGYNNYDINRMLSYLRGNYYIVYSVADDRDIYIASIPDDVRDKLINKKILITNKAEVSFKSYMTNYMHSIFKDSRVLSIRY